MTPNFVIPTRRLIRQGSSKGVLGTLRLEDVRDTLAKIEKKQDPIDHDRSLNQLHVDLNGGQMTASWLNLNGISSEEMLVSKIGAEGLAGEVLPAHFFGGLKTLAEMDSDGEKLATMAWAKFANKSTEPSFVRTVKMAVPGGPKEGRRVIRSRHSQSYATYSHLEFVQAMLDSGHYGSMPVIDWSLSDAVIRVRFAGCREGQIELNKPIPMTEGWNSEVGKRKVLLKGGIWKLVCTNGMGSWDSRSEFSWIHRGDCGRIKKGVKDAFQNLQISSSGVLTAYNEALEISIQNAFEWMTQQLTQQKQPLHIVKAAQNALHDPTTTPGGKLASVCDVVTLIAQDATNMIDQYELERLAASILHKGRGIALRHNGKIPVIAA